jgi:hypothetical protein
MEMTEAYLKIIFLAIVFLLFTIYRARVIRPFDKERRRRLDRYRTRSCTGSEWRRAFPNASKDSIRDFLESFTNGFAFRSKRRLKFSPDDKIMDIYKAHYPSNDWIRGDALELETFSMILEEDYKINLADVLTDDLTLGQLFEMAARTNPNNRVATDAAKDAAPHTL